MQISAMPSRSSVVSVGRPIMKYNFTLFQPPWNAISHAWSTSSSRMFLLITSRRRWVPASQAKVRPLLRVFCTRCINSALKLSARSEGSDRLICRGSQ